MATIINPMWTKFKPSLEQLGFIRAFLEKCQKNDQIDHIAICLDEVVPDCGIYYKGSNGEILNIKCLAVASDLDRNWYGIDLKGEYCYFKAEDVC